MLNLHSVVLIAHVFISIILVILVLLQRGKGAEAGAAFGSGASGTVFGAKGSANFLSRSTAVLATLFFVTSLGLTYLGSRTPRTQSLMDEVAAPADEGAASIKPVTGDKSAEKENLPDLPELEVPAQKGKEPTP